MTGTKSRKSKKSVGTGKKSVASGREAAPDTLDSKVLENAAVVRDYLRKIDFRFSESRDEDSIQFRGSICGEGEVIDVFQFSIIVENDVAQCFMDVPVHAKPPRRAAVAEYCSLVNYPLKFGKLVEDIRGDGEISFHVAIPAAALKGDPDEEVDRLIGLPMAMLERFTPGLVAVLQGHDPREAYETCVPAPAKPEGSPEGGGEGGKMATKGDDAESGEFVPLPEEDPDLEGSASPAEDGADPAADYSLDGLNVQGDVPLSKVVAAVRKFRDARTKGEDAPRMNILLSGPSGCGKTEFVKYLGREVGAEVMTISASDVLSPMVGRTERNLARIFREARKSGSILFLDEVDSLLSSRANAHRSWEVTQVNELLQQMERFGGIMVGATNFETNLDSAVARRFTFKMKMDYLTSAGKRSFFERYFKTPLTQEEGARLEAIAQLTPGDFRTARQKLYYLSDEPSNESRLAALETESAAKGSKRARIGF